MQLKGGFTTRDPRLDRVPQFDERSRDYPIKRALVVAPSAVRSYTWAVGVWLDQGTEGACVGFSRAQCNAARPVQIPNQTVAEAKRIYQRAQVLDEWPGEDYSGTSVLAGIKAAQEFGYVIRYLWAFTLTEVLLGVGYRRPCVVGLNWYDGMFDTDSKGFIAPTGYLAGGHAILLNGVKIIWKADAPRTTRNDEEVYANVDVDQSYVTFWNSWGSDWGRNGTARMTVRDFDRLRKEDGECSFVDEKKT